MLFYVPLLPKLLGSEPGALAIYQASLGHSAPIGQLKR